MKLRTMWGTLPIAAAVLAAGCHDLQAHRLQRMNRGRGLSPEVYYSVPDPEALPAAWGGGWELPVVADNPADVEDAAWAAPADR